MKNLKKNFCISLAFILSSFQIFANCNPSFTTNFSIHGDTVCVGVPITFTNTSDMNGTIISTQWNFGDASPNVLTENATHTYTASGTFTVTYTIGTNLCSVMQFQKTIYVITPPSVQDWGTDPCFDDCNGTANIFINGTHNNYSILWDDPNAQTTETAGNLCEGSYTATVSDVYGCITISQSVLLTELPQLIVNAGSDIYICIGDTQVFSTASVSGGGGQYFFNWEPGTNAGLNDPTILNPTLTANNNSFTTFYLNVTDNNGCMAVDDMQVMQSLAEIRGHVIDDLGLPLSSGNVYLYKKYSDGFQWELYDIQPIQPDGGYQFLSVPIADVTVLAKPPLTNPVTLIPTYYGNQFDWIDAHIISPECGENIIPNDITCINVSGLNTGDCTFNGGVYYYTTGKTESEDPIPFIDVVVKKTPPGNAMGYNPTDTNGEFEFQGVETGQTYSFVVNIPGIEMNENYFIEVAADDILFENLKFYVDTTEGATGVYTSNPNGLIPLKRERKEITAFPNPFSKSCELHFPNSDNGLFSFALFDVTGKRILQTEKQVGKKFMLQTATLEQGIYIAEIKTETDIFKTRLVKQ